MAIGADAYTEALTATRETMDKTVVDQTRKSRPALDLLIDMTKSQKDRDAAVIPIEGAELGRTAKSDRRGTFSTASDPDILGAAKYSWADPIVTSHALDWLDVLENDGPGVTANRVKRHLKAATKDNGIYLEARLHALAAAWTTGDPLSFDMLFADGAYSTSASLTTKIGGINPNVSPHGYWQAVRNTVSPSTGVGAREALRALYLDILVASGGDAPTHYLAGRTFYDQYVREFDDSVRRNQGGRAESEFEEFVHNGTIVRFDPQLQDTRVIALNREYIEFPHLAGQFMAVGETQVVPGTQTKAVPINTVIQFCVSKRSAHGILDWTD